MCWPSFVHCAPYPRRALACTERIADQVKFAYRNRGVELILGGFLHFQEEIEYFDARVLPLVREIEAARCWVGCQPAV